MRTIDRALVTGVAGFIGSSIASELIRTGVSVVGIDNLTSYYHRDIKMANLRPLLGQGLDFREADVSNSDLPRLLRGVDTVFHQAGQPGVRPSWGSSFAGYTLNNINATQLLLEAIKDCGQSVERVVYASSSSVYGNAETFPTNERAVPEPVSPYGVTKLAGEHLMSLYGGNFGIPTTSLRYFTVYGPRQRPDMAFTRFLAKSVLGDTITIYGDGEQIRDFTYIDDVVQANVSAATSPALTPGSVYNVSGGSSVSVREVLSLISDLTGADLSVSYVDRIAGDAARTGGDSSKARTELSWSPKVELPTGLSAQLTWVRENLDLVRNGIAT